MSARETAAIVTAREEITTALENEEDAEDFHFTGEMQFIGNRVWHKILITIPNIFMYVYIDNDKNVRTAMDLSEVRNFDFS